MTEHPTGPPAPNPVPPQLDAGSPPPTDTAPPAAGGPPADGPPPASGPSADALRARSALLAVRAEVMRDREFSVHGDASDLIDWVVAAEFLAGGLLGGLVGLGLASRLSANKDALNRVFAAVVFIVASYVLYRAGSTLFTR